MQQPPPAGLWTSDEHSDASWAPAADSGTPGSAPRPSQPPEVGATSSSTENPWEEDSSPTQTYSPQHMRAAVNRARVATPSEVRSAEAPVELEPNPRQTARLPQAVDPATAAALASLRPFVDEARVRQEKLKAASRLGGGTLIQPGSPMPQRPSLRTSRRTLMGVQPPAIPASPAPESEASPEVLADVGRPSSIAPVEQPLAARLRGRGSWVAWAIASAVIALGVGFYVFSYVPLQAELARAKRDSASQAEHQSEAVRRLQENLDRTRSDLQQQRAPAAQPAPQEPVPVAKPEKPAHREPAIAVEPRPEKQEPVVAAERPVARVAKPKPKAKPEPSEPAEPKPNHGVDREAAAAATAALEAQAYGSSAPAPSAAAAPKAEEPAAAEPKAAEPAAAPKAAAPKPAEPAAAAPRPSREPLLDVENEPSDDPLEGL